MNQANITHKAAITGRAVMSSAAFVCLGSCMTSSVSRNRTELPQLLCRYRCQGQHRHQVRHAGNYKKQMWTCRGVHCSTNQQTA